MSDANETLFLFVSSVFSVDPLFLIRVDSWFLIRVIRSFYPLAVA